MKYEKPTWVKGPKLQAISAQACVSPCLPA
jgi:hypothetical protein